MPRPGGVRRRLAELSVEQRFLLAGSFLIPLGSFAVLPYMSVLLHERLGMGLGTVGTVLAVASFVQFSGGVAGAALAGRIGLQRAMLLALAVRTCGFAAFLPGMDHPPTAVAALFLVSCGAALYIPANKAYLVHQAGEAQRPLVLSASSSAINAGIALGPVAAAPFVLSDPATVFGAVAALFAALTAGHALLPREGTASGRGQRDAADGSGPRRRERPFAGLAVLPFAAMALSLYIFMFFQHYLAVYAVPRTSATFYGAVLGLYALLLVIAQPLLADRIAALPYARALWLGFAALGSGMATLAWGHPAAIAAGALLVCAGEIVLFLKNDLEALARSPRAPAVVFGRQRLAAGLGAFAAGILGGKGYELAERTGHAGLFWLAVAAQCALLPTLLAVALRRAPGAAGAAAGGPGGPEGRQGPDGPEKEDAERIG